MKKTLLVLAILSLVVFVARPALAADPIKIGIMMELTGPLADYGALAKQAMEMRFEEANYTVAGRPIKVIWEDDASDPVKALEKAKKLVEADKVDFLIGPIASDAHLTIAPYLAQSKILDMAIESTEWDLHEFGNWFAFPGTSRTFATPMGDWLYEKGYRTMATLGADYAFGYTVIGGPADRFKERGGKVIQEQWVPYGTMDYGPFLTNLKKADVFMIWEPGDDMMRLLKQYFQFGLKMPIFIADPASLRSEHMAEIGEPMLGMIGMLDYTWRIDHPANHKFVKAFEAKFGGKPEMVHSTAYSVVSIYLAGLEATGGDASFEVLREAILGLKTDTPHGPTSFSRSGFAITPRYMVEAKIIEGRYVWEPFKTYPAVRDPRDNS
jgi:branched-chain amino acid transport system substrate-binding protein